MEKVSAEEGRFDGDFTVVPVPTDSVDFSFESIGANQAPLTDGGGFTLDDIRVPNTEMPVTTKVQARFSVGRPQNSKYIQVHPNPGYCIDTHVVNAEKEGGYFLPARPLWDALEGEPKFQIRRLVMAITAQGEVSVWPLRLPGDNGRTDPWMESELELAERAKSRWLRIMSSMSISRYVGMEAQGNLPEPAWPDMPFEEMLKNAFRERMITSLDHPVLKRLRGEIV